MEELMLKLNEIYCSNCLEIMREIDSESINCVVTSPPYWALRDYQTEPRIWDGDKGCEHEWGTNTQRDTRLQAGNPEFQRPWREQASGRSSSQFCIKCGAWKGS